MTQENLQSRGEEALRQHTLSVRQISKTVADELILSNQGDHFFVGNLLESCEQASIEIMINVVNVIGKDERFKGRTGRDFTGSALINGIARNLRSFLSLSSEEQAKKVRELRESSKGPKQAL